MQIILFDTPVRHNLLPFTFTRPIAELRVGILTIREKWEHRLNAPSSVLTEHYLQAKYPFSFSDDDLYIAGNLLPDKELTTQIEALQPNEGIVFEEELVAYRGCADCCKKTPCKSTPRQLRFCYDLFLFNKEELENDFTLLTENRIGQPLSENNRLIGENTGPFSKLFIEEGANVHCATLNVSAGPIYVGRNATIMEGSLIRGGAAFCEGSTVKMGSRIYENTTIGPHCKVGGEIAETIFIGYSNKAHDGYIGNSVVGEWCNIGAGVNCSNLKNDYTEVKLWNYPNQRFLKTGLQFCGLMLGDHSKIGIGSIINTGTVIGVGCNIHGSGFPRNFIPSFQTGGTAGYTKQNLKAFLTTAQKVMMRRQIELDPTTIDLLTYLYQQV